MTRTNINTLLKIASNQISRRFDAFAKKYDTTWVQMSIIDFLSHHQDEELYQRDIENEFFIQRSTATIALQRMEKKQLIYRQPAKKDARQKSVFLTDKARLLEKEIKAYMIHQQEILENNFSSDELKTIKKFLQFQKDFKEVE
ncbi:MarR family transcriptional regulator [Companilactobacillus alimentarius]|uniref:MarR family transcriptional regulator n=1 Tax=Companilactobacillus alimentarius DSM 20249 TaxID=1423720 RepID=A0A2K9HIX0_9LACO|nr:MarR family transcriptional regulator [Companilactobacillus alimentarius]AUI72494.1 MarR family transcriptional regulator [Companilactobacillus alimentarius DSM 20249]KRK77738.1 MarR family transcriptional regulator [Companilactobacillus alimentarius DSM 20249]MDT6953082.1 MarR family transcriptional regulator [Companilactobacillus alimentarius]GEO45025.1 transcriptional regulator [Companilactobacillus alimentarius]